MIQVLTAVLTMVAIGTLLETFFVDDRTFAQMTALGIVWLIGVLRGAAMGQ